jgi:sulfatase maturation enzyme AslB (radical SAM superfamily)
MIDVPEEYAYVGVFLTLRCNFTCKYCINEKSGKLVRARAELTTEQWIETLNNLKIRDDVPITIGGGEPTVHKDFFKIISKINHPIDLLTNLEFDIIKFIHNVDPVSMYDPDNEAYKSIRVSFHPEFMEIDETIAKAVALQEAGFNIGILPINHPENTEANLQICEEGRKNQIYIFIKDFLGEYKGQMVGHYKYPHGLMGKNAVNRMVQCRTQELLIAPNGNVFGCHRDLYTNENATTNITDEDPDIDYAYHLCDKFGYCNPCDLKLKVNRFLQMGSCSVDIKPMNSEGFDQ